MSSDEKRRQEFFNIHLASLISQLGIECRGERFKGRRVPDLEIRHPRLGLVLGEAEIGSTFDAADARKKLEERADGRFKDTGFIGFDYVILVVYPEDFIRTASKLSDREIPVLLKQADLGIGLAGRKKATGLGRWTQEVLFPRIEWRQESAKPAQMLQAIDELADKLMKDQPRPTELAQTLVNVIDGSPNRVRMDVEWLKLWNHKAELFEIDCSIFDPKKPRDCAELVVKTLFTLCCSCLIVYELARSRLPLNLRTINPVTGRRVTQALKDLKKINYVEAIDLVLECLDQLPDDQSINQLLASLYETISCNIDAFRYSGWEVLAYVYQRLLSETFRKAYATFYTKLPAAHLLARLAVDRFTMRTVDPAMGSGSLLLASFYARQWRELADASIYEKQDEPALDYLAKKALADTVGLDALRGSVALTAAVLSIASLAVPRDRLKLHQVPVDLESSGSLELLNPQSTLFPHAREAVKDGFDLVIMNPPFTRSDRISTIAGESARKKLLACDLSFGGMPLHDIFAAGMAKPFLALADRIVKAGGTIAAVLPNSILGRPAWTDVRNGLVNAYDFKNIVVSWAPGTPNFSSDTQFREILIVVCKRKKGVDKREPLKVINLTERIDDVSLSEAAVLAEQSRHISDGGNVILGPSNKILAEVVNIAPEDAEVCADNLYRLIAFRSPQLLELHLQVIKASAPLTQFFDIGSVVDHKSGLRITDKRPRVHHYSAIWGSGGEAKVLKPLDDTPKHFIVIASERQAKVRFWRNIGSYQSKLFIPRRGQLDTQYLLMFRLAENAVSNVWWPLAVRNLSEEGLKALLLYMNSIFGFVNMLGERLETRGLWVEYKKEPLAALRVPDFDKVKACVRKAFRARNIDEVLTEPIKLRFGEYIERMSELEKKCGSFRAAFDKASQIEELAQRAFIDKMALEILGCLGIDVEAIIGRRLYGLVASDVEILRQIMESREMEGQEVPKDLGRGSYRPRMVTSKTLDTYMKSGSEHTGMTPT